MIFEKVYFNDAAIRQMSQEDFVERHLGLFWKDRDEDTRRKMLTDVYSIVTKVSKRKRK